MTETNHNDDSLSHTTPRAVVISLHGIKTRGTWQKEMTSALNVADLVHEPLDYGDFAALRFLCPGQREKQMESFREEYTQIRERYSDTTPSIIAHSFGTYIVANCMEKYTEVRFDRIIFCGAIVRKDYPWSKQVQTDCVSRVLNDYGRLDRWARIVQWVVEDAGPSGLSGFDDEANGAVVQRCHPKFKHSDYFYRLNYQDNWIPFLKGTDPSALPDEGRRLRNWRFTISKLLCCLVCVLVIVGLTWWAVPCLSRWWSPLEDDIKFPAFVAEYNNAREKGGDSLKTFNDCYGGYQVTWECYIIEVAASDCSYTIGTTKNAKECEQALAIFGDDREFKPFIGIGKPTRITGAVTVNDFGIRLGGCHFAPEKP